MTVKSATDKKLVRPLVNKLPALTGLRFFAAAAIVVLHGMAVWAMPEPIARLALNQGVSFFFVLSGFILTYVNREFHTAQSIRGFYVARFARVWPVHIAATIFLFVLMPNHLAGFYLPNASLQSMSYFTLTQAWIPLWDYFLSFNGVSWTVSVEMFFYLLFPLFLTPWWRREWPKLVVAGGVAIAIIVFANATNAPNEDWAPGLTRHGLIYIFPPSRLFEFVCGVVAGKIWLRREQHRRWTFLPSLSLELLAAVAVYLSLRFSKEIGASSFVHALGGDAGAHWIAVNGLTPCFVLLVYVFASSTGPVSKFVGWRPVELLGEISFSLYLVHTIVLTFFERYANTVEALPGGVLLYWAVCLMTAFCMWHFIEKPSRNFILGSYKNRRLNWRPFAEIARRWTAPFALTLLLLFFGSTLAFPKPEVHQLAASDVVDLPNVPSVPTVFGGTYRLLGIRPTVSGQQTYVNVFFQSAKGVRLDKVVALHALAGDGSIFGQAAAPMDTVQSTVDAGTIWSVQLVMANGSFPGNPSIIGIALYDDQGVMPLTEGVGDWDGKRYIFELSR